MSERHDAIVIGLGGMGSAAAYHLARRGRRVLGLEQHDLLHERGSSHGLTRIIRLAYHEDPSYVPLLRRAYDLWHELEEEAGERLLVTTGCLEGGPEDGDIFRGALEAARVHGLEHEVLDPAETVRRYPAYAGLDENVRFVWQPDGGFLLSERSVLAHVNGALAAGADLRFREPVVAWEPRGDGVVVTTGSSSAPVPGSARSSLGLLHWRCRSARCSAGSSRLGLSSSRPNASRCSCSKGRPVRSMASRSTMRRA
jgi:sarcosine oxidase